ncbi:MAG: sigma 54-interacting transcriptional regulator, partial [Victivallales bacterium]|nr:sigma 54-interacting transcriptional regulator [Victivallales bacterium]
RFPLIADGKVIGAIGKVLFRNIDELNLLHRKIIKLQRQVESFRTLPPGGRVKYSLQNIIGNSDKLLLAKAMAKKAGMTDSNVLLRGESGTGKELFAHAIHHLSIRSDKPFVKVNCAAIPAELLESELFGYEEGAFTGARRGGKAGKIEIADGGTLFLDEIGDMPAGMQAKLLRALQEKEVEKIGSTYPLEVDVRIIAATNQELEDLVVSGKFRADLFYRLNVVAVKIPPLRERPEDIELLAPYLLDEICSRLGKYVDGISPQALMCLKRQQWPGNVRELKNVLERAVNIIGLEGIILPEHLTDNINEGSGKINSMQETLECAERAAIEQALNRARNKKAKAARLLNISRSNLYQRMLKLNM